MFWYFILLVVFILKCRCIACLLLEALWSPSISPFGNISAWRKSRLAQWFESSGARWLLTLVEETAREGPGSLRAHDDPSTILVDVCKEQKGMRI